MSTYKRRSLTYFYFFSNGVFFFIIWRPSPKPCSVFAGVQLAELARYVSTPVLTKEGRQDELNLSGGTIMSYFDDDLAALQLMQKVELV